MRCRRSSAGARLPYSAMHGLRLAGLVGGCRARLRGGSGRSARGRPRPRARRGAVRRARRRRRRARRQARARRRRGAGGISASRLRSKLAAQMRATGGSSGAYVVDLDAKGDPDALLLGLAHAPHPRVEHEALHHRGLPRPLRREDDVHDPRLDRGARGRDWRPRPRRPARARRRRRPGARRRRLRLRLRAAR